MPVLRPGELIDERFEVLEVLGVGGFGTVYKAKQQQFERLVAIKLLHQAMADSEERARFDREAKAMNALKHKNIVGLYGVGFWNGAPYMVTELASGQNLFEVLAKYEQFDRTRAVNIIRQVLAALSCAHQEGVIHRDLKPSNILLTRDPDGAEVVKIIDFGLAKMLPGYGIPSQKLTETGFALGTAQYMSPEQCMGSEVDGRSDLYSAGCILYQMLTGRLPFDAVEIVELMYQQLNATPPPLSGYLPQDSTTAALQNFCDNCLAKDRDMRYANADEALRDINAIGMGESRKVKAFAPPSSSKKKRAIGAPEKRSRWRIVAGLAAFAIVSAGAFAWLKMRDAQPSEAVRTAVNEKHALELGSAVIHSSEDSQSSEGEQEVAARLHEQLVAEIAQDQKDHLLTPYHRARLSFLLALWYRDNKQFAEAEKYARVAWSQYRLASNYPARAGSVLMAVSIQQGKFEQADDVMRELMKGTDENPISLIRSVTSEYASVNRMDRAKQLIQSVLAMPNLSLRVQQFCYCSLGDSSLSQGRVRDAQRFYDRGVGIVDSDTMLPNPCWLGVARLAFFEHDVPKAHKAMLNIPPSEFGSSHFPEYSAWELAMADAAWSKDRRSVEQCAVRVLDLGPRWIKNGIIYVTAFDDEEARKALDANGFEDVEQSLSGIFRDHIGTAERRSRHPKMREADVASGT